MYVRNLLYILLWASIPISVHISLGSFSINTPSEWLAILFCAAHLPHIFTHWRTWLRNPITVAILFSLGIIALTTLTSSMFAVSLKWFLRSALYTITYYLLPLQLLRQQGTPILAKALTAYTLSIAIVCIYTWAHHATYHFTPDTAILAPQPFFPEHTLLGATLTIVLLLGNAFLRLSNTYYIPLTLLLASTLYDTYSRAAWLTLVAGICLSLILHHRRHITHYVPHILATGCAFALALHLLPQNTFVRKIQSVTNLTTDVSNLERLNRYACAWDMFCQRPLTGYGPGTYQFQYLPFQKPERITRISVLHASTNHPNGRGGTAHSEYLLALSESGIGGALYILALVCSTLYVVIRRAHSLSPSMIAALAALSSFGLHALVNNFFEYDKIAAPVLLLLAFLAHTYTNQHK